MSRDEVLAEELGAAVGQIERENDLRWAALRAEFDAKIAALEAAHAQATIGYTRTSVEFCDKMAARLLDVKDGAPGPKGDPGESIEGPPGRDGTDGRSFTVRGTYGEGETYDMLSVVALGGSSFVALRDDPGPCPGDGWQLLSPRGKAGPPGPKGDRGDAVTGPPGPPGPGLAAMTLSSEGVLTLTFEDGRSFSQDFYQPFSQMIAAVLAQLR